MHRDLVDWTAAADGNFVFPTGVAAHRIGDELAAMLVSPDPRVRDERAYTAAAGWIRAGHLDDVLVAMGDTAVIRPHRCPACNTMGLMWRDELQRVLCTNRRCVTKAGMSRTWSLARLAHEHVAVERYLHVRAT